MATFGVEPVGWRNIMTVVAIVAVMVGWCIHMPETLLIGILALAGGGNVLRTVTDTAKIKANGNGKAPKPCDTTGAPDNRGAS